MLANADRGRFIASGFLPASGIALMRFYVPSSPAPLNAEIGVQIKRPFCAGRTIANRHTVFREYVENRWASCLMDQTHQRCFDGAGPNT